MAWLIVIEAVLQVTFSVSFHFKSFLTLVGKAYTLTFTVTSTPERDLWICRARTSLAISDFKECLHIIYGVRRRGKITIQLFYGIFTWLLVVAAAAGGWCSGYNVE